MNGAMDPRIAKTLESIKNGFAECIRNQPFSDTSVRDITTAAKINRSTFYKYYEDKYHLRSTLVDATLRRLAQNIDLIPFDLQNDRIQIAWEASVQQIRFMGTQRSWYLVLWNKNMELPVFDDMARLFERRTAECLLTASRTTGKAESEISEKQELFVRLFAASAMATVKWWYECVPALSAEEVAKIIMENIRFGMYRTFLQTL